MNFKKKKEAPFINISYFSIVNAINFSLVLNERLKNFGVVVFVIKQDTEAHYLKFQGQFRKTLWMSTIMVYQ